MEALGLRLRRVFSDIFRSKNHHDDREDEQSITEVTPVQIPKIPPQWKVRHSDTRQIAPSAPPMGDLFVHHNNDRKDSIHEINSYEVSL